MPALIAHGWQDYNVKQEEGVELFKALDGEPFKKLFMFQGGHGSPPDAVFLPVLDAFFDRVLLGRATGIPTGRPVDVRVTFKNQDWTLQQGHRIALVMQSSNSAWAVPDTPGLSVQVASGRSRLVLPVGG